MSYIDLNEVLKAKLGAISANAEMLINEDDPFLRKVLMESLMRLTLETQRLLDIMNEATQPNQNTTTSEP